jgi:uncharacterized protein
MPGAVARALRRLVHVYRFFLSPFIGQQCRFSPTCSCYMEEALARHGAAKGLCLGLIRIAKCQPFSKTPWTDPVPDRFAWADFLQYKPASRRKRPDER